MFGILKDRYAMQVKMKCSEVINIDDPAIIKGLLS